MEESIRLVSTTHEEGVTMLWIGIVFTVVLGWDGNATAFGVEDEHFESEQSCWEYFRGLPTFEDLTTGSHTNFYDSRSKVRFYKVNGVGNAWVSCKEKNSTRHILQEGEDAN